MVSIIQSLKDVEHFFEWDIAAFDLSFDELKDLSREAWRDEENFFVVINLKLGLKRRLHLWSKEPSFMKSVFHKEIPSKTTYQIV